MNFAIGAHAALEWLPQETIVFKGADAQMRSVVHLAERSVYIGWEILCLGRQASGEQFSQGCLRFNTELWKLGERLWVEQARLAGGDALLHSPIGLAGQTVCATLIAAGCEIDNATLAACREVAREGVI